MVKGFDVTVEHKVGGIILLSAIVNGYLFRRRYIGYTVKEVRKLFNTTLREEIGI